MIFRPKRIGFAILGIFTPKRIGFAILGMLLLTFPWLPFVHTSLVVNANLACEYAIITISLVLLTGWVGQISLGQATFVGIGAFTSGLLQRGLHVPFPLNLPLAAAISGGVAALLGLVALRVRGLYLAVATLIFAWMADAYLFTSAWFVGRGGSSSIENHIVGRPGTLSSFDLSNKSVLYLVMVAAVAATLFAVSNLRDSKTGRAFFAIRGSEVAAVSLGIDVTRYKLIAFAISGTLAGVAGNLILTDLRTASPDSFSFTRSLFFLSVAVVGGVTSLPGAVGAAALFAGLNEVFFRIPALNGFLDIVAVGLLLVVLLAYPGGLGAIGGEVRRYLAKWIAPLAARVGARISEWIRGRSSKPDAKQSPVTEEESRHVPPSWRTVSLPAYQLPSDRSSRTPVLEAHNITVRFGGLTAVDGLNVEVREHEIVGLIGPNGAGKTTSFNAISGLNEPSAGTIRLFGKDATKLPVHVRAQLGVGRTFQLIQLFPQLTVFENLLVATHVHNDTGIWSHIALTDRAVTKEQELRDQVGSIVDMLGLHDVAGRSVAGLPFGVLRQVEIARALVTRAPFLMLDEPASGLDNAETEELTKLLYFIRAELGVSILLIEHDVKMVTSVSDYMYVINRGTPLAEGTPQQVQRNPDVIAAYLGESAEASEDARPLATVQ